MPVSEGFYRDQKKLHLFFLASSFGLLVATVWMLAADHLRPWKVYQRKFAEVQQGQAYERMQEAKRERDVRAMRELEARLATERANLDEEQAQIDEWRQELLRLKPIEAQEVTRQADLTAFLAEEQSKYDLLIHQLETASDPNRIRRLERKRDRLIGTDDVDGSLTRLQRQVQEASIAVERTQAEIDQIQNQIDSKLQTVAELEKNISDITSAYDQAAETWTDSGLSVYDEILAAPIIDGFASPLKINQQVLPHLPLDYNFKKVTRHDRCMTCHLGADQSGLTRADGVSQPFCSHPHLDLYVGARSPHPVAEFGCTVCHDGQGSATEFKWASHTPNNIKQSEEWRDEHGWFFNHFHEQPMLPTRFTEASCLKCHHDPYEIPQAEKLNLGYKTVRDNGCFGCHEINGYKDDGTQIGPHLMLTGEDQSEEERKRNRRKVGPSLRHVKDKLDQEFVINWLRSPVAFRPDTRMPQFYEEMDSGFFGKAPAGEFDFGEPDDSLRHDHSLDDLSEVEIHAITAYLFAKSQPGPTTAGLTVGDGERGKQLFASKGCVSCHEHKEFPELAASDFGPNLSEVGAKFTTNEQKQWLASWIHDPAKHNPHTYMPNLQLTAEEAGDIAAYLTSVPGQWQRDVEVTPLDQLIETDADGNVVRDPLRDSVFAIIRKGATLDQTIDRVGAMDRQQQLMFLGERTIGKLGCYGCHDIEGFETTKPIGVGLADWGRKDNEKLAFENVHAYVTAHVHGETNSPEHGEFYRDNDYFLYAIDHHLRDGFLMQKLREPRSYDYEKIRRWDERTRMPKFNLTDEERDAVATFVLGLVAEEMNPKYVYDPEPRKKAEIKGRQLLDEYNCVSCHVIKPGEYRFTPSDEYADFLVTLGQREHEGDMAFNHPAYTVPPDQINQGRNMVVRGLPDGSETEDIAADPDQLRDFVKLWEATSVDGQVVPAGLRVAIPQEEINRRTYTPSVGGEFAKRLVDHVLAEKDAMTDPAARDLAWSTVPPPLIWEGEKVQTDWLYSFLRDPAEIRPAALLRMPKFNYRVGDVETLANYFAAAEGTKYPYADVEERLSDYLAQRSQGHPDYLHDAYRLITNKDLCVKCHSIGANQPTGKPEELGPRLSRTPQRLRPDWMFRWIANPKRMVPYTAMPLNFPKDRTQFQDLFEGTSEDHVRASRDALINYDRLADMLLRQQAAAPQDEAPQDQPGDAE